MKIPSLHPGGFVRSAGVLVGGTALAHVITFIALPFITRFYTPEHFSLLAVFAGIVSIFGVAACLRLDIAVPLPKHDAGAANILALALGFALLITLVIVCLIALFSDFFIDLIRQPELKPYLWLVPIGVWATASFSALQMWSVRCKDFSFISSTKIFQSAAGTGTQVWLGLLGVAPLGLLLGQLLNSGAGSVVLGLRALTNKRVIASLRWSRMRAVLRRYQRFPKYSTFEALANSASVHLPVILIAAAAAGPEAGYLMLALYAMQAPMSLIGTAVSQVYLSRAPEEHRSGRLGVFTVDVIGGLLKTGVGPLLFAGIVAPVAFAIVFGEPWHRAGVLVSWMTPWFVMQFLSSPVSVALHVTNNLRVVLAVQVFGLIIRVLSVVLASAISAGWIAESYALSGFVFYLLSFVVVLKIVAAPMRVLAGKLAASLPILGGWIFLGIVTALSFTWVADWLRGFFHAT